MTRDDLCVLAREMANVIMDDSPHLLSKLRAQEGPRQTLNLQRGDENKPTIWLLGWRPGDKTEIHDHGDSEVAVVVIEGNVVEDYYRGSRRVMIRYFAARDFLLCPAPYVHRMRSTSEGWACTVHFYVPRLCTMGIYDEMGERISTWEEGQC